VVRSARERARAQITEEIVAEGRRQLAEHGAAGLSLRAVAREVGMVSSAIYRYFASRDELLTALIIDAYDSLGDVAEEAARASRGRPALDRWVDVSLAIRTWALSHRNEYALIYGTPVPGYEAPADTTASGTRVSFALIGIVRDATTDRALEPAIDIELPQSLTGDVAALRQRLDLEVSDHVVMLTLLAWTQLFGLLSFELFSQTRGVVTDHDALYRTAVTTMGRAIGL
jgi:AcrR family transcriptional regulator